MVSADGGLTPGHGSPDRVWFEVSITEEVGTPVEQMSGSVDELKVGVPAGQVHVVFLGCYADSGKNTAISLNSFGGAFGLFANGGAPQGAFGTDNIVVTKVAGTDLVLTFFVDSII